MVSGKGTWLLGEIFAKKIVLAAIGALSVVASPATAALVADYQLNGSLADSLGGADLTNNGGTLGANGISFGANQGPSLGGFSNASVYSVVIGFSFDALDGYRKILDFANLTSDGGLYNLSSSLNFYPIAATVSGQFQPGVVHRVVFTRGSDGTVVSYVDGNSGLTFLDTGGAAVIGSTLHFLNDDFATGQGEASSGFVDYIQIYDTALTGIEVVGGVPEPTSWMMLIAGFGLVGAAARRRRMASVAA